MDNFNRQALNLFNLSPSVYILEKGGKHMLITEEMAERVRVKRAIDRITAKALAEKLGITHVTLAKVENGDYDAPRRIYQSVMAWLTEDL